MTKITISVDQLRSIIQEEFDWEAYEKGRADARNFAKDASYREFIENRNDCIRRMESCSFEHTPGPSYWTGCLLELDMVRVPDAVVLCRKDCLVLPSEAAKKNEEQAVIRFTDVETEKAIFYHFNKRLNSSQAKDLVRIVDRLMKDSLTLDKQKALFKGIPKFMEKYSLDGYMIPADTIHVGKDKTCLEKQEEQVFGFVPEDKKGSLLGIEQNGRINYLYSDSKLDGKTLQKITESMQQAVESIHGLSFNDICRILSSCIPAHGEEGTGYNGIQMYFAEFGI